MVKKTKTHMNVIVLILMICLIITQFASAETSVSREIHPATGSQNNLMEITLHMNGIQKAGIIETLPPGTTFISTTDLQSQFSQSGNNVIFAVLDDSQIEYLVQTSGTSVPSITGKWEDIKENMKGEALSDTQTGQQNPVTPSASGTASSPGFGIIVSLLALALIVGIGKRWRS
jgi:hypothetical protein